MVIETLKLIWGSKIKPGQIYSEDEGTECEDGDSDTDW